MKNQKLELANFVLNFGDDGVLVDQLESVVLPAFFGDFRKSIKSTHYFLFGVELSKVVTTAGVIHVVAGRLVKDTLLVRERLYDAATGELIRDEEFLKSSPSSFFAIILETHRLMFVREHPGSPTLEQFRSTMQDFFKRSLRNYTRILQSAEQTSKPDIAQIGQPVLEIVPMFSAKSLNSFLESFETLSSVTIEIARTNNETDNTNFIELLRESHKNNKAKKTVVRYTNSDGLSIEDIKDEVGELNKGMEHVRLIGKGFNGNDVRGSNEHFSVSVPVDELPDDTGSAVDAIFQDFDQLATNGRIDAGTVEPSVSKRIATVFANMNHSEEK